MIAGAVQRYLQAQGLDPVRLTSPGDYQAGQGAVYVVWAEERGDVQRIGTLARGPYTAGLQVRARHDSEVMAMESVRQTMDHIRALPRQTISYTLPDGSSRSYRIRGVRHVNGPATYPQTPGAGGYMATSNYELRVEDVP